MLLDNGSVLFCASPAPFIGSEINAMNKVLNTFVCIFPEISIDVVDTLMYITLCSGSKVKSQVSVFSYDRQAKFQESIPFR